MYQIAQYGQEPVIGIAVPTRVWMIAGGGLLAYFLLRDTIRQVLAGRARKATA